MRPRIGLISSIPTTIALGRRWVAVFAATEPGVWLTHPCGGSAAIVAKGLAENGGFTAAEMRAIDRDNALRLLPRLRV